MRLSPELAVSRKLLLSLQCLWFNRTIPPACFFFPMKTTVSLLSQRLPWAQIADLMKVAALLVLAILCRYVLTGLATSDVDGALSIHATFTHPKQEMPIDPVDLSTVDL